MKKATILFALFFCFKFISASHIAGGELTYKYIGGNTGVNGQYRVDLILHREITGTTLPSNFNVSVKSSCFNTLLVPLGLIPDSGELDSTNHFCSSSNKLYEIYDYSGVFVVVLPNCNFNISFSTCCRPYVISNVNGSNDWIYLEATKSVLRNSSSQSTYSNPRSFCVGRSFIWPHYVVDADGDSIYVESINPKHLSNGVKDVPFFAGFSTSTPISVDATVGFNLDSKTGNIYFKPKFIERDLITLSIKEYRLDTLTNLWVLVGSRILDKMADIGTNCTYWPADKLEISDTVKTYSCGTKVINVDFKSSYSWATLDTLGSDFFITNPTGNLMPILKILPGAASNLFESHSVDIFLYDSLDVNGTYKVFSIAGADGNTLLNSCGEELPLLDTAEFMAILCPNISIVQNEILELNISPNPVKEKIIVTGLPENEFLNIEIIDFNGRVLYSENIQTVNSEIDINTTYLVNGFYLLKISYRENIILTKKFIKQ